MRNARITRTENRDSAKNESSTTPSRRTEMVIDPGLMTTQPNTCHPGHTAAGLLLYTPRIKAPRAPQQLVSPRPELDVLLRLLGGLRDHWQALGLGYAGPSTGSSTSTRAFTIRIACELRLQRVRAD